MVEYEYANNHNKEQIEASLAPIGEIYYCIECDEEMYVVNRGSKQSPHFRHKVESNSVHEGALHFNTKCLIYDYVNSFFVCGSPLYVKVKCLDGFTYWYNILNNVEIVQKEKSMADEYRPDVSIIGTDFIFSIEIIDTHPLSSTAKQYIVDNDLNLIEVNATIDVYEEVKNNFHDRIDTLFASILASRNTKFSFSSSLEQDLNLKKQFYENDATDFNLKKQHEIDNLILPYENDAKMFLEKMYENYNNNKIEYFQEMFDKHRVDDQNFITWVGKNGHTYLVYEPFDPDRFCNIVEQQTL